MADDIELEREINLATGWVDQIRIAGQRMTRLGVDPTYERDLARYGDYMISTLENVREFYLRPEIETANHKPPENQQKGSRG